MRINKQCIVSFLPVREDSLRIKTVFIVMLAVLAATGSSSAALTGYITTGTEVVWTNFDTGEQTSLGPSGIDNIMAMDISPVDGSLYATEHGCEKKRLGHYLYMRSPLP